MRRLAAPREAANARHRRSRARPRAADPSTRAQAPARCAARDRQRHSRAASGRQAHCRARPVLAQRVRQRDSVAILQRPQLRLVAHGARRGRRAEERAPEAGALLVGPRDEPQSRAARRPRRSASTSTPASTFKQPSSQPPFGTESMCPPISSARSDAPRSVNHWLPASSISSTAPVPATRSRRNARAVSQVSVHATRCAPSGSPVKARSSSSSATVRPGSSVTWTTLNLKRDKVGDASLRRARRPEDSDPRRHPCFCSRACTSSTTGSGPRPGGRDRSRSTRRRCRTSGRSSRRSASRPATTGRC